MVNFLKRHWLFIILAALATALTLLWWAKPGEKEKPKIQGRVTQVSLAGKPIDPNTKLTLEAEPKEKEAQVLTFEKPKSPGQEKIDKIVQKLGFTNSPTTSKDINRGTVYSWTNTENFLTIVPSVPKISFGFNKNPGTEISSSPLPGKQEAKEKLNEFIDKLELPPLVIDSKEKFRYISVFGSGIVEKPEDEAGFLEIDILPSFEGKKIIFNNPEYPIIKAWINRQGQIVNFEWENPFAKITKAGEIFPVKGTEEIRSLIYRDGRIVRTTDGENIDESPHFPSIRVSGMELSYLYNPNAQTMQPIFTLTGTAQLFSSGDQIVWLFLPALKDEVYAK